jgi:hypothetical protein
MSLWLRTRNTSDCQVDDDAVVIDCKRGDTWRVNFQYMQDALTPFDLTDSVINLQIRSQSGILIVAASVDPPVYLTVIDAIDGKLCLELPHDVTMNFPIGIHAADLEIMFSDFSRRSSRTFYFNVVADQTRP